MGRGPAKTKRGIRLMPSVAGSQRRLEELSGIHDAVGIPDGLDAAHQCNLRLAAHAAQPGFLAQADAVLGGDTAAMSCKGLHQHRGDVLALLDEHGVVEGGGCHYAYTYAAVADLTAPRH